MVVRVFESDALDYEEHIITMLGSSLGIALTGGGRLGFLLSEDNGIYEYGLETGRGNLLLNPLGHGLNTNEVIGLFLRSDGDIICILPRGSILARTVGEIAVFSTEPDHVRGTMEAYRSEEGVPPIIVETKPPKEKEIVTLAVIELNTRIKERVTLFNKTNPDYTIEIIDYLDGRDEIDAIRQFIIDFTHDPADIIVLKAWHRQSVPIHSYARKGLFADLYEIMDADPNFDKADYLPNVFKALEMDGRLYSIFPEFWLHAIVGKASDLGASIGWSIDEFITFLDTKDGAEHIIGEWTEEKFISGMIEFYFTDPETGGMKFDREAFLKILTAAERFPKNCPTENNDYDWHDFMFGLKDGNPL